MKHARTGTVHEATPKLFHRNVRVPRSTQHRRGSEYKPRSWSCILDSALVFRQAAAPVAEPTARNLLLPPASARVSTQIGRRGKKALCVRKRDELPHLQAQTEDGSNQSTAVESGVGSQATAAKPPAAKRDSCLQLVSRRASQQVMSSKASALVLCRTNEALSSTMGRLSKTCRTAASSGMRSSTIR